MNVATSGGRRVALLLRGRGRRRHPAVPVGKHDDDGLLLPQSTLDLLPPFQTIIYLFILVLNLILFKNKYVNIVNLNHHKRCFINKTNHNKRSGILCKFFNKTCGG